MLPAPSYEESAIISTRWLVLFALLAAASLVPIWICAHPPLPDLAAHLASGAVLHFHDDPRWDFARYYALNLRAEPYWGYHAPLHVLAFVFPLETANRLVLSLYVVGLPLGLGLLARTLGRSPLLALFGFPLVWSFGFSMGFLPFCMGVAALPYALAAFDHHCAKPTLLNSALAVFAGIAMFFTHLLPWTMFVAGAAALAILHEGRSWRRAVVWLPSVIVGVALGVHSHKMHVNESHALQVRFVSFGESLKTFCDWLWSACAGHEDKWLALVLAIAWIALVATAREKRRLHDWRVEALALIALVAYFATPRAIIKPAYWWGLNVRFAALACLFGALCVPGAIAGRRRFLLAPVALVGLGFAVDAAVHWKLADRYCQGFDELAAIPEPGARVLFLIDQPWHDSSLARDYAQAYSGYYQARRGGYLPWSFADDFPIARAVRYPAPEWHHMKFEWDAHARYYDYVMTFQETPPFDGHWRDVRWRGVSGRWTLWQLPGPRVDDPPPIGLR